jgi:hypothetical protein
VRRDSTISVAACFKTSVDGFCWAKTAEVRTMAKAEAFIVLQCNALAGVAANAILLS